MNVVGKRATRQKALRYPSRIQFYEQLPENDVTVEEFEGFALDRLQGSYQVPAYCARHCLLVL